MRTAMAIPTITATIIMTTIMITGITITTMTTITIMGTPTTTAAGRRGRMRRA